MQKAVTHIRAVLGRILVLGLSLQIVFGLAWMCCSFTGVQWFAESTFYVRASESLICDEYTGILYPFLLMLTGKKYLLLCLLQLTVAFGAGYAFVGAMGAKTSGWRIWGSLVLLTYPMAMQCHMAVLPNSFTFSCFLLELACVLAAVKKERNCWRWELLGTHGAWLCAALLQPDYLYLGAVPVILFWAYDVIKYRKTAGRRVCYHFLLAAVFAGLIATTGSLTTREGYYGRTEKSIAATIFQRVTWSGLEKCFWDWPVEVRDLISEEIYQETLENSQNMLSLLMPEMEKGLGVERARKYYIEISRLVWDMNYFQVCYEMLWDAVGNVVPPVALQELLDGRGYISAGPRNYETMRQECPVLTKYYMQYAAWWFVTGSLLAALVFGAERIQKQRLRIFSGVICLLSAVAMVVWYTMSAAGAWDYKDGLFAGALWIIWMIGMAVKGTEER